jgi:hypothetical protein
MPAFVPLLSALGMFLGGAANFIQAVMFAVWMYGAQGDSEALRKGLEALRSELGALKDEVRAIVNSKQVAQEQPPLSSEVEALYAAFLQQMDLQCEIGAMLRHALTLPALPEEGH